MVIYRSHFFNYDGTCSSFSTGLYKYPHNWGIPRPKNETVPDAGKLYTDLLQKNGGFYLGDTKKKDIYLTFDNGYENGYTGKILDVLKEKKYQQLSL